MYKCEKRNAEFPDADSSNLSNAHRVRVNPNRRPISTFRVY